MSRIVRFPDPVVRGRVYVRPRTPAWSLLSESGWRRLGEAAGTLTAPADTDLKLVINAQHAVDLSWLCSLHHAGVAAIEVRGPTTGEQLKHVAALPEVAALRLMTRELAPASIAALARVTNLQELRLGSLDGEASITTDALAPLEALPIRELQLDNIPAREGVLGRLRSMSTLRLMRTTRRSAADVGIRALGEPAALQHLALSGTGLNDDDVRHIGRLHHLLTLNMTVNEIGNDAFADWAGLTALHTLRLDGLRSGDQRLRPLRSVPALASLALPGAVLQSTGVEALGGLRGLRTLLLDGAQLPSGGLRALFALTRLERLRLSEIEIPEIDLTGIGELVALQSLMLDETSTSIDTIEPLRTLPALEELDLSGHELGGMLGVLGELPDLQQLGLHGCALTDTDVTVLRQLRKLRFVALGGNRIGDSAVGVLTNLQELRELNLSDTEVTDNGCAAIARLVHLHSLDLRGVRLTGARLGEFGALTELSYLRLTGVASQHGPQFAALTGLRTLVLDHVEVDVWTARAIGRLPSLRRLELIGVWLSEEASRELAGSMQLEDLAITDGGGVAGDGFGYLARLPGLRRLDVQRSNVGDAELRMIAGMRSLEWIDVRQTAITHAGLRALIAIPSLQHVAASGGAVSPAALAALSAEMPNCWYVG
jgi:Leucine-rich repeat (LRR) protein